MPIVGRSVDTSSVPIAGGAAGQVAVKASNNDNDITWASPSSFTQLRLSGSCVDNRLTGVSIGGTTQIPANTTYYFPFWNWQSFSCDLLIAWTSGANPAFTGAYSINTADAATGWPGTLVASKTVIAPVTSSAVTVGSSFTPVTLPKGWLYVGIGVSAAVTFPAFSFFYQGQPFSQSVSTTAPNANQVSGFQATGTTPVSNPTVTTMGASVWPIPLYMRVA